MLTTFKFTYGKHSGQVQALNHIHAIRIVRETYGGCLDVMLKPVGLKPVS